MVPSSAHDPTAETEQSSAEPEAQPPTDSAPHADGDPDSAEHPDAAADAGQGAPAQQGEASSHSTEPVDVAPDPEQTGIEVSKAERIDTMSEEEIERVRQERLDPENRPDNAEVDNTQRDFDTTMGTFEDSEADPPETAPFIDPENPNEEGEDDGDADG